MSHESYACRVPSPVGELLLVTSDRAVTALHFPGFTEPKATMATRPAIAREALAQLRAYFAGELKKFDLSLEPDGGTPFQQRVWKELRRIPYGVTCSYAEIAKRIGKPKAMRAVGAANGQNPICIVIPCHRVIGADGTLTGFGGGMGRKAWLLRHEGVEIAPRDAKVLTTAH